MLMSQMITFRSTCGKEMGEQTLTFEAAANVYLFVIQQGSYPKSNKLGIRFVALTASLFAMMMYICYTTDITAKMTSGPPVIPIRNFEDVILHDYRVIVWSGYYKSLLANGKPGTAKHIVYNNHFEGIFPDWEDAMTEVISKPKTLLYRWKLQG